MSTKRARGTSATPALRFKRSRASVVSSQRKHRKKKISKLYVTNNRWMNGVPRDLVAKMMWSANFAITCSAGATGNYQFRLNSLYDPDFSGTGSQPQLYDQLIGFYTFWNVYGVLVELDVNNSSTAGTLVTMRPTTASSAPTNIDLEVARGFSTKGITQSGSKLRMVKYIKNYEIMGVTKEQLLGDDTMEGVLAGNPPRIIFLNVVAKPLDAASTVTLYCNIKMSMYSRFTGPKDQVGS